MFGFSFYVNNSLISEDIHLSDVKSTIVGLNFRAYNHMIDKFAEDKVFFENDEYVIIIDGVILNKEEFIGKSSSIWADAIIALYKQKGDTFFNLLKGSFSGVLYDKARNRSIMFSDQIGSKFMYYCKTEDGLFFSSYIYNVYSFLKQTKHPYSLNIENAYLLLTYGYMLEDRTLCDKIFKIKPGCYIVLDGGKLIVKQYFLLDNTPDCTITQFDAIDLMDNCFRNAIKLQFDKDVANDYRHLVALSAGLDSRMVTWVAHEMGYKDQINFTFSQTNYWDQTVPQKITADLKHEWIFKALDNGLWLYDVDDVTKVTGGNVLYYGQAHSRSLMKYLNFNDMGLIHSGQQGDIAFDTYYTTSDTQRQFELGEGAFTTRLLYKIKNIHLQEFKNEEIANYYYRSFSGANHGLVSYNNYTEVKSPFADVDVLQTILKIPLKYRMNRNLYFQWILNKYPKAANYVWDHIEMPINRRFFTVKYHNKRVPIETIPKKITQRVGCKKNYKNMNPLELYLQTNNDLRNFYNHYFDEYIDLVGERELRNDLLEIKESGNAIEKVQAISLLSALKLFFDK